MKMMVLVGGRGRGEQRSFMGLVPGFLCMSYWSKLNHITTSWCKGAQESKNLSKRIRTAISGFSQS